MLKMLSIEHLRRLREYFFEPFDGPNVPTAHAGLGDPQQQSDLWRAEFFKVAQGDDLSVLRVQVIQELRHGLHQQLGLPRKVGKLGARHIDLLDDSFLSVENGKLAGEQQLQLCLSLLT